MIRTEVAALAQTMAECAVDLLSYRLRYFVSNDVKVDVRRLGKDKVAVSVFKRRWFGKPLQVSYRFTEEELQLLERTHSIRVSQIIKHGLPKASCREHLLRFLK